MYIYTTQHNILVYVHAMEWLLCVASYACHICVYEHIQCILSIFYVYNIQILTVKIIRSMSVFMGVQGHVCVHTCGGQRITLGIHPQVLSIFLNMRSRFGLELSGSHRMTQQ